MLDSEGQRSINLAELSPEDRESMDILKTAHGLRHPLVKKWVSRAEWERTARAKLDAMEPSRRERVLQEMDRLAKPAPKVEVKRDPGWRGGR